jgi:hypothetical protein
LKVKNYETSTKKPEHPSKLIIDQESVATKPTTESHASILTEALGTSQGKFEKDNSKSQTLICNNKIISDVYWRGNVNQGSVIIEFTGDDNFG